MIVVTKEDFKNNIDSLLEGEQIILVENIYIVPKEVFEFYKNFVAKCPSSKRDSKLICEKQ